MSHILGGMIDAGSIVSGSATDGQVLTADGAGGAAFEDATGGGGGTSVDYQVFTASGTWTKPANALWCTVFRRDGGNGGNAGNVSEGNVYYGDAGDGKELRVLDCPAAFLPASVEVTVGAGGAGGTSGDTGGKAGGSSQFGLYDESSIVAGYQTIVRKMVVNEAAAGGAGGDPDSAGADAIDVNSPFWDGEMFYTALGLSGGTGGAAGSAGVAGGSRDWIGRGGGGGGGGTSDPPGNGGAGGKGGIGAGGGGGGAPGTIAMAGGDGGAGGDGIVIVYTLCGA